MGKLVKNGIAYGGGGGLSGVIPLTRAEYEALPDSKLIDGNLYLITDEGAVTGTPSASDVSYDNKASGLVATNMQEAVDSIVSRLESGITYITEKTWT